MADNVQAALAFAFAVIRRSEGRCGAEAHIRPYTEGVTAYVSLFVPNESAAADTAAILRELVDLRHKSDVCFPGMVFFEALGPSNIRIAGCADRMVWAAVEQALALHNRVKVCGGITKVG